MNVIMDPVVRCGECMNYATPCAGCSTRHAVQGASVAAMPRAYRTAPTCFDPPPPAYTAYRIHDGVMVQATVVGMCMEVGGTLLSDGDDSPYPIVMIDYSRQVFQRHGGPVAPFPRWWWNNDTVTWERVESAATVATPWMSETKPVDPLDVEHDGKKLRDLIRWDELLRQDTGAKQLGGLAVWHHFTPAQRSAVSAHWSAQLRAKVAETKQVERNKVTYCEDEL